MVARHSNSHGPMVYAYIERMELDEPMFELFLRLQHECPHNELSTKFPKARISLWCNTSTDILEIEADGLESYEGIQKEMTRQSKETKSRILSKTLHGGRFQIVVKTCSCGYNKNPTEPIFEKHNFLEVPPVILTRGWEYYRLVGFDPGDLKGLLQNLDAVGETEVLHKMSLVDGVADDTFMASLSTLFGQLTRKQLTTLVNALENGYYEVPKRVTTETLAHRQGQPQSTLEEHLRKAESKVLHALRPFMTMYSKSPTNHPRRGSMQPERLNILEARTPSSSGLRKP